MSRKKLFDAMVIIDLEATCDDPRPPWESEIIEVGVCLLDLNTLDITAPRGLLVKPVSSPITPFCTQLTTLTQEVIERDGMSLPEAMKVLEKEYKLDRRCWGSWGDYDRKMLLKDCAAKGIKFPGESRSHRNIKNQIATDYGWSEEQGLDKALERFKLTLEGTHHRGVDDAMNIAKILRAHMKNVRGLDT